MLVLQSGRIGKCEYLTGEKILPTHKDVPSMGWGWGVVCR